MEVWQKIAKNAERDVESLVSRTLARAVGNIRQFKPQGGFKRRFVLPARRKEEE